jgi:adenylyl-sulfate kinase
MDRAGFVVWLTGLSGAGKSTLAAGLAERLRARLPHVEVLDGDEVRHELAPTSGFSRADRDAQVARLGYIAHLLSRNGVAVIVAAVSPYQAPREAVRDRVGRFVEVHVDCPLEVLIQRDAKGLYRRALAGEITNLTGVNDPYEPPPCPAVRVDTSRQSVDECLDAIVEATFEALRRRAP